MLGTKGSAEALQCDPLAEQSWCAAHPLTAHICGLKTRLSLDVANRNWHFPRPKVSLTLIKSSQHYSASILLPYCFHGFYIIFFKLDYSQLCFINTSECQNSPNMCVRTSAHHPALVAGWKVGSQLFLSTKITEDTATFWDHEQAIRRQSLSTSPAARWY